MLHDVKIEIKNLKTAEFASRDSLCFECSVYVNGKRAFMASDDGNGGCINMFPIYDKALYNLAEKYAESLPPYTSEAFPDPLPYDLELLISELVEKHQELKWLKSKCKGKTLFRLPEDTPGTYRVIVREYTKDIKDYIKSKYPTAEIANERLVQ